MSASTRLAPMRLASRHDMMLSLVVLGQRQEQVHLFHALIAQQVFVGGLALQHQHPKAATPRPAPHSAAGLIR